MGTQIIWQSCPFVQNPFDSCFIGAAFMVSVKHQTGKQCADSHGKQTHSVAVSRNIISIKQQVSQNQSGLIKHKRIMTPENDKKRKCRHIQKQRLQWCCLLCQMRKNRHIHKK